MLLRPRQKQLVDKIIKVLEQRNKSFFIAPTGSGKTIMLSFILKHCCVLKL
ncbi:DEAD/DEAH box helicase family protein [Candidatus Phytoplasma asteris]|uniref:DEAD/DEAH box helicase n=1 Tax=Candidatus Phytoplasma asteris TaxID=85620 RepID=A0ABZ3CDK4_9MOLU